MHAISGLLKEAQGIFNKKGIELRHTDNPRKQENMKRYGNTDPAASKWVEPTIIKLGKIGTKLIENDSHNSSEEEEEIEVPP